MPFRSKSPQRVLEELAQQTRRYHSFLFEAVDNILDMRYLTELFPALVAQQQPTIEMFFEVKANLTRAQLRLMAEGGVTHIQPGLESLQLAGPAPDAQGCAGGPERQRAALGAALRHAGGVEHSLGVPRRDRAGLRRAGRRDSAPGAPAAAGERGRGSGWSASARSTSSRTLSGVRSRTPERSYRYVYPGAVDLERVGLLLRLRAGRRPAGSRLTPACAPRSGEWSRAWEAAKPPTLTYWSAPGFLQIYDGRRTGARGHLHLRRRTSRTSISPAATARSPHGGIRDKLGLDMPAEAVQEIFAEFQHRGLMFLDGPLALALALPATAGR